MYKIGEFSKITKLTVKTLRYYDEQDINPSYRNKENGYRFYEENDFKKAQVIVLLRNLEFSIAEMKDVLSNYEDFSDLSYFLQEKKKIIEDKIKENLNVAYKAIFDYAQENNIKCMIPAREIYIKGPGMIFKGNPNKYVTEIIIPIA